MKNKIKYKKLLGISLLLPILSFLTYCNGNNPPSPPPVSGPELVTMVDNQSMLSNPGMGWNQMFYTYDDVIVVPQAQRNDMLDWMPCDILSFRISWNKMEPAEGQYNWDYVDQHMQQWVAAGKRVAFKWYTNFLQDNAHLQATPLWVKNAGAQGQFLDDDGNPTNDTWAAYYGDPILLEKLGNFYKAAAEHYKNIPIEFIELGSIGRVGEGNEYQMDGLRPTAEELKMHIDLLRKAFPNTQLIINDDHRPEDMLLYAKSQGYGIDDHSIGVGGKADDPNNPGRGAALNIISKFHDGTSLIALENDTWHTLSAWYSTQMKLARANYCRVHINPWEYKRPEVQTILKDMNLNMGYRIQFPEISSPSVVKKNEKFTIKYKIKNVAAGYCHVSAYPTFTIKDSQNKIVSEVSSNDFDTKALLSGADEVVLEKSVEIIIPASASGKQFTMFVSMADNNKKPLIKLPYNNNDGLNRYKIKQIETY